MTTEAGVIIWHYKKVNGVDFGKITKASGLQVWRCKSSNLGTLDYSIHMFKTLDEFIRWFLGYNVKLNVELEYKAVSFDDIYKLPSIWLKL